MVILNNKFLLAASVASIANFALAVPGVSAPRTGILGRQTTAFVNIFTKENCADEDFLVALGINDGPVAGPENCVSHNAADELPGTQQPDGSYRVFLKPTSDAIFAGAGQVIVRSPVVVDVENCGTAVHTISEEGCFAVVLANTFFLQGCLKSDTSCVPQTRIAANGEEPSLFQRRVEPDCYSSTSITRLATDQTKCVTHPP